MAGRCLLVVGLVVLAAVSAACAGDGPGFSITPRVMASATPTEEPLPTRTPRPPPTPTHTPAPSAYYVANTGGDGAVLRAAPGKGDRVAGLAEGARVVPQGEEQEVDGRRWLRVQEPGGRTGWIAGELLVATPLATRIATPRR